MIKNSISFFIKKCKILSNFKVLLFLILITFIIQSTIFTISCITDQKNIAKKILRLHIIANSDNIEDQSLKLKVRDSVLSYISNEVNSNKIQNKDEIIKYLEVNDNMVKNIALNTIRQNGFNYNVSFEIKKVDFPTKYYGELSMPSGVYDSVQIKIGDAKGKNWWCVLFPPLCFNSYNTNILDENLLKENLTKSEYELVTENNDKIKFKFKILELIDNTINK